MSEHKIPIPSMLYNAAVGGHVTNSQQIIDENLNREQNDINQETVGAVPYNSTTPNGMGRIVLKKNDNFKTVVEAQTNGNTIFVIKYDFTLTGNVTVPTNCILEFDGGSISGAHTVTGTNTGINADLIKIFNIDITIVGSWNVAEAYPEWFGAKGDGIADDTSAIQKIIDSFNKIRILDKIYVCSCKNGVGLVVSSSKIICGNQYGPYDVNSIPSNCIKFINTASNDVAIQIYSENVKLSDIQIVNNGNTKTGIGIKHCRENEDVSFGLSVENVRVIGFKIGAVLKSFLNVITNYRANHCELGMLIIGSNGQPTTSNSLRSCYFDRNDVGLEINGVYHTMINCAFDHHTTALKNNSSYLEAIQTSFEDNKQAILCIGNDSHFIGTYHYESDSLWDTYDVSKDYIRIEGEHTIIEDMNMKLNHSQDSNIDINNVLFKCFNVIMNGNFNKMLTIKGKFPYARWIKASAPNYVLVETPEFDCGMNFNTMKERVDYTTTEVFVTYRDYNGVQRLWNGTEWVDATGTTV